MNLNHESRPQTVAANGKRRRAGLLAAALTAGIALSACGSSSSGSAAPSTTGAASGTTSSAAAGTSAQVGGDQVLPVTTNPIDNPATAQTLVIDSVLVENNVGADGTAAADHLEIALANSGATSLAGIEIFYTFDDPIAATSESYYAKLPATFTIPAGGMRVVHFDDSGTTDHFPVNKFSLYYTDTNAMDVTVMASATDAAPQTMTVKKDAGGPETAD